MKNEFVKQNKLKNYKEHYNSLQSDLSALKDEINNKITLRDDVAREVHNTSRELLGILELLSSAKEQLESVRVEANNTKRQASEFVDKVISELKSKEIDLKSSISQLEDRHVRLNDEIVSFKSIIKNLENDAQNSRSVNEFLETQKKSMLNEIENIRDERSRIETDCHDLNLKKTEIEIEIVRLTDEKNKLSNFLESRAGAINEAYANLALKEAELEKEKKNLLIRESRYKKAMSEHFPHIAT